MHRTIFKFPLSVIDKVTYGEAGGVYELKSERCRIKN